MCSVVPASWVLGAGAGDADAVAVAATGGSELTGVREGASDAAGGTDADDSPGALDGAVDAGAGDGDGYALELGSVACA